MAQSELSLKQQKMAFLEDKRTLYRQLAGGWPPNIPNEMVADVRLMLVNDLALANSFVVENPNDIQGKVLWADLLRVAHNLSITGASTEADKILREILEENPKCHSALVCIASLYVSVNPDLAKAAEHYFNRALELTTDKTDPVIFQGLGFANLHQQNAGQAIYYFKKYLQLVPDDKRIKELISIISSGALPKMVHEP